MLAAREGGAAPSAAGTVTSASASQAAVTPSKQGPQQMDMFGQPDAVADSQPTEQEAVSLDAAPQRYGSGRGRGSATRVPGSDAGRVGPACSKIEGNGEIHGRRRKHVFR